MTTQELLSTLSGLGVTLTSVGGSLRYQAPAGAITPAILTALAAHKAAILPALELRQALDAQGVTLALGKAGQPVVRLGGVTLSDEERAGLRQHREVLAAMLGAGLPTLPPVEDPRPIDTGASDLESLYRACLGECDRLLAVGSERASTLGERADELFMVGDGDGLSALLTELVRANDGELVIDAPTTPAPTPPAAAAGRRVRPGDDGEHWRVGDPACRSAVLLANVRACLSKRNIAGAKTNFRKLLDGAARDEAVALLERAGVRVADIEFEHEDDEAPEPARAVAAL